MLGNIYKIDMASTSFLAHIVPHTLQFDHIFSFFSLEGISFFVWIFFTLLFLFWRVKEYKKIIFYFLISFSLTWILVNTVIKNIVRRERPWIAKQLDITVCPNDFSFPSGHASSAFAGATVFAYYDKKRRLFYFTLAALISYSRIYLYCHYLLDVSFGALLGYAISKIILLKIPYKKFWA